MNRLSLILLCLVATAEPAMAQYYSRVPQRRSTYHSQRRPAKAPYRLDSGDYLAVIVDGVLGSFKDAPVHMPGKDNGVLPSMGHPVPVLADGTVFLPLVRSVSVRGLTVVQANKKIAARYIDGNFLKEERSIIVSLMRKRTVRVTVLHSRRDARGNAASTVNVQGQGATVLSALAEAGAYDRDATVELLRGRSSRGSGLLSPIQNGDTINMKSPPIGTYFTSGLLPGGEHEIPIGRAPTMLQAMAAAGGTVGGRFGPSHLMVIPRNGRPYYLDAMRGGRANRVSPGDTLILQYRPREAAAQFATQTLLPLAAFGAFGR
jgi:protein involved in polysaccharide export with SLBB domain